MAFLPSSLTQTMEEKAEEKEVQKNREDKTRNFLAFSSSQSHSFNALISYMIEVSYANMNDLQTLQSKCMEYCGGICIYTRKKMYKASVYLWIAN